jgi:hypothetical protein
MRVFAENLLRVLRASLWTGPLQSSHLMSFRLQKRELSVIPFAEA